MRYKTLDQELEVTASALLRSKNLSFMNLLMPPVAKLPVLRVSFMLMLRKICLHLFVLISQNHGIIPFGRDLGAVQPLHRACQSHVHPPQWCAAAQLLRSSLACQQLLIQCTDPITRPPPPRPSPGAAAGHCLLPARRMPASSP